MKALLRISPLLLSVLALCGLTGKLTTTGQDRNPSPIQHLLSQNSLGVVLMEQFKYQEAFQRFSAMIQQDPEFVPGHVNQGIAYFNLQDYDNSLISLGRALELDEAQIQAFYVRGLIYRNRDQVEEAITEFLKVNAHDPRDPSTNYFLGLLFSRQGNYTQAIQYLQRVVSEQPYNASAQYNLAIARLRSGDRIAGTQSMNEFRRLQGMFGTTTIGLQYLEQGKYSLVIDNIPERYLPEQFTSDNPINVTFTEVAASARLRFKHAGPGQSDLQVKSREELEGEIVPFMGSGLAFADYDGDGWMDLFLANASSQGAQGALFHNQQDGTFREITDMAGISHSGKTMAALWGDFNNDTKVDLYLINYGSNILYQNNRDGTFSNVTFESGLGDPSWGMGGVAVDFDHDGDLDILVSNFVNPDSLPPNQTLFPEGFSGAENKLYRNNGDGTFLDVSRAAGLSENNGKTLAALCTDFDNSRDIDFYLVNLDSANQLFSNLRDGTFQDVAASATVAGSGAGAGVGIGDLNRDGYMDLLLPTTNNVQLLLGKPNKTYESTTLPLPETGVTVHGAHPLDFDNDGDLDVLLVIAPLVNKSDPPEDFQNFYLLENRNGSFRDISGPSGLDGIRSLPIRGLSVADFDRDGDLDFAANVNGSSPLLFRNDGGNQNNWITIQASGTNSNRSGIGSKVEVKSGRLYQKAEIYAGSGFLSQSSPLLHFGLGKRDQVDMVRIVWPGGVLQSEVDHSVKQTVHIQELDRKGTSCPILYAWDGDNYRFQTDFLGGSAYGSLLAPGIYSYPDTDEYIKLNREQLALKNGKVAITLNNQLEEVILFDQLELVAVDHPTNYEIYPDEKLLPGPPFQDFRLFTTSDLRLPVEATDGLGRNILPEIGRIDRTYPKLFQKLPFKGYADRHEIILDLGETSDRALLLLYAWIDYADSTSNLAASQAGHKLVPPYLQVKDKQNRWVTVIKRMGFPAGLPKWMTVNLSNRFLSDSRKVRIVTNMRIHWDQILVEAGPSHTDYRLHRVKPSRADLHFLGYPEFLSLDHNEPKVYRYQNISSQAQWKVHMGGYTRYGEVSPLLKEKDDMFVITRSGDEIEAFFEVGGLPELPHGWVRDYLVYVDGFGKDMDINSSAPDYIGPLPFHGMSAYPYPDSENYPDDEAHRRYLREWNTRVEEHWIPELKR